MPHRSRSDPRIIPIRHLRFVAVPNREAKPGYAVAIAIVGEQKAITVTKQRRVAGHLVFPSIKGRPKPHGRVDPLPVKSITAPRSTNALPLSPPREAHQEPVAASH